MRGYRISMRRYRVTVAVPKIDEEKPIIRLLRARKRHLWRKITGRTKDGDMTTVEQRNSGIKEQIHIGREKLKATKEQKSF